MRDPLPRCFQCIVALTLVALVRSATIGSSNNGYITFYGSPSTSEDAQTGGGLVSGACGYGVLSPDQWPFSRGVALGPNNTLATAIGSNKLGCGQCILATCSGSNCARNSSAAGTELLVTDGCPTCDANQLNIPASVFLQYFGSSLSLGRVNITYQEVECSPPGNIQVKVIQATPGEGGYIAVNFLSVAGSGDIAGVDIKTAGSRTWAPMMNTYGSVWSASNFGEPPLDLRLTSESGQILVAMGVITNITNATFPTSVQFGMAPAPAPARSPTGSVIPVAPLPGQISPIFQIGVRLNEPLYFAPIDSSALSAYPGITFTYTDCSPPAPTLNITINRMSVPSEDGTIDMAWAIHTLNYLPVETSEGAPVFKLLDYSFLNLETGVFAQLYEEQYLSFANSTFNGSIPAEGPDNTQVLFPTYVALSTMNSPSNFEYSILLPPSADEQPTDSYLTALGTMYYYVTTLALGSTASIADSTPCAQGIANLGPWADYLRSIIGQLAPASEIIGDLYNNIPLGTDYAFQGTSFTIKNGLLMGNVINSSKELSSQDCGSSCVPASMGGPVCRAWSYCGAISGCMSQPYQQCSLMNSTRSRNLTAPNGFLNLVKNSSTRSTSGALFLPPPPGLSLTVYPPNISTFEY